MTSFSALSLINIITGDVASRGKAGIIELAFLIVWGIEAYLLFRILNVDFIKSIWVSFVINFFLTMLGIVSGLFDVPFKSGVDIFSFTWKAGLLIVVEYIMSAGIKTLGFKLFIRKKWKKCLFSSLIITAFSFGAILIMMYLVIFLSSRQLFF